MTPELRDFLMQSLGLAAIGTVCDVVPLVDENRVIVRHGLLALRSHPQLGIQALAAAAARGEKDAALSSEDIAFSLGPRLNAAGRLGQAQLGVELLTTSSVPRAAALAEYLHALNDSRDSLDRRIFLSANKQIEERFSADESAFVLADADWHAGIIGIVAGRIAEKRHRPTLLISLDPMQTRSGMGSGRSAGGLDLYQALQACREHLLSFGGHAAAAGFRIAAENIDAFRAAFLEHVETHQSPEERVAELQVDAEAFLSQLTLDAVIDLERLAPFGQANPRPLLAATNVQLADAPRYLGTGQRHLAVQLAQHEKRLRAVAFGRGDWLEALGAASHGVDIVFRPVINAFRGRRSVELHLVDWRPAAVGSAAASSGGCPCSALAAAVACRDDLRGPRGWQAEWDWHEFLSGEFAQPYFRDLQARLGRECSSALGVSRGGGNVCRLCRDAAARGAGGHLGAGSVRATGPGSRAEFLGSRARAASAVAAKHLSRVAGRRGDRAGGAGGSDRLGAAGSPAAEYGFDRPRRR